MIHVVELSRNESLDKVTEWGRIVVKDFRLPQKVHRIKGILCCVSRRADTCPNLNIVVGEEVKEDGSRANVLKIKGVSTIMAGSYDVCVNDNIIVAGAPAVLLPDMEKRSYNQNRFVFDEPVLVSGGSKLRIVFHEGRTNPFRSRYEQEQKELEGDAGDTTEDAPTTGDDTDTTDTGDTSKDSSADSSTSDANENEGTSTSSQTD